MTSTLELYQQYHAEERFADLGSDTFLGEQAVAAYGDARSVLDFGCGNGYAVRQMRARGAEWHGLEYSQAAFDKYLNDPWFHVGELGQFESGQFDLIYSTEVLEHIPESQAPHVVSELCRVAARYLFLTISLRPSADNNRYHCTLKPRIWWESLFTHCGWQVDQLVVDCFQKRTLKSTRKILSRWSHLGPDCAAFAANPPYELHGETQFWHFCFRRPHLPRRALPTPTVPYWRRRLVPQLRRLIPALA